MILAEWTLTCVLLVVAAGAVRTVWRGVRAEARGSHARPAARGEDREGSVQFEDELAWLAGHPEAAAEAAARVLAVHGAAAAAGDVTDEWPPIDTSAAAYAAAEAPVADEDYWQAVAELPPAAWEDTRLAETGDLPRVLLVNDTLAFMRAQDADTRAATEAMIAECEAFRAELIGALA